MFTSTNIETYGYCNRHCEFCFNAKRFPKRKRGIMPEWVWNKIIDDLANMDYKGRISPHFYGEPLMDKRLPQLIDYASNNLDGAIIIGTNGDFLTATLLEKLIKSGLSCLLITEYDNKPNPNILCLEANYPEYIRYRNYKDIHDLMNRAGQIFNHKITYNVSCSRPERQLVINWDGEVLLCCCDFYAKHSFGNVKNQSLNNIWNSKKFIKYRNMLNRGEREKVDICKYCNAR